jgi:hypothetical protein
MVGLLTGGAALLAPRPHSPIQRALNPVLSPLVEIHVDNTPVERPCGTGYALRRPSLEGCLAGPRSWLWARLSESPRGSVELGRERSTGLRL